MYMDTQRNKAVYLHHQLHLKKRERERERESECECESECVCVCVRERERESVCERESERVSVWERESVRDKSPKPATKSEKFILDFVDDLGPYTYIYIYRWMLF